MDIVTLALAKKYADEKLTNIDGSSSTQSDWNQNDETALDYIKNRPFYSTGEYESKELLKDFKPTALGGGAFILTTCPVFIEGQKYQVILNNEEFICVGRIDNEGSVSLGNINYETDGWTDEHEPFSLSSLGGMGILNVNPATTSTEYIISISEATEKIQLLDKKYIKDYLVGEKTEGKELVYEDKTYTGGVGSEIFNSPANKAIGNYSHAEGADTVALGDNSHAEGFFTKALVDDSHAEGNGTYAEGNSSHAEGYYTQTFGDNSHSEGIHTIASGDYSHVEGENTIANSQSSHVQGRFNILDSLPKYTYSYFISNIQHNGEENVYTLNNTPILNAEVGTFDAEITETQVKNLKTNDLVIFSNRKPFDTYYNITEIQSDDNSQYQLALTGITTQINRGLGKYVHIVGNGTSEENRSNAHTLDWEGNAWYQGDVYVGSTSGINMDEGSKKLATEDFVKTSFVNLNSNTVLSFYCIEDVTIVTNGISKVYPANSNVEVRFTENDVFEIIPTSNNSIFALNAFPGALNTFYPWLEGVKQFSNILFDMNSEDMYTKWSQGNQGVYKVQFAQYMNCIFWSDNPYINEVAKRTNYALYNTSQIPLCYSNIPENTFKSFYLALGVVSDPNWANPLYRESFANASWATQAFSYYGARTIGLPGLDSSEFNIVLPKDCRGLMFDAGMVENAGVFDAINVTDFGAKSGSWRDAFGKCTALRKLYIKNLKVNLNLSWSPIEYNSISYIISKAANTNKITISVSPYTYYLLTSADFDLAASKNITIALLSTNYVEDKRLGEIAGKADKAYVDTKITDLVNSAPDTLDTLGELAVALAENQEVVDVLDASIANKQNKNVIVYRDSSTGKASMTAPEIMKRVRAGENVYYTDSLSESSLHPYLEGADTVVFFYSNYIDNDRVIGTGILIGADGTITTENYQLGHLTDNVIHITSAERNRWNDTYTKTEADSLLEAKANQEAVDALNEDIVNKVDKEEDKGLSTNDYTNEDKTTLADVKALSHKNYVTSTFLDVTLVEAYEVDIASLFEN